MRPPAGGDVIGRLARLSAGALVLAAGMTGSALTPAMAETPTSVVVSTATAPTPPTPPSDPARAAEYWLDDYGIRDAWKTTKGEGTTIAIIDTGISRTPAEFSGAVAGGADFSESGTPDGRTPVGAIDADHGSWVGSLAAARGTGPDTGMLGVAPEAQLLSLSIGFGASSSVPFVTQVADAMRWAVDHGADVINLSFTTNTLDWDRSWDDAFLYAYEHDVVVVVAAGNRGSGTDGWARRQRFPASSPSQESTARERPAMDASTQGITIGIAAPSEQLLGRFR